jgi:hypothetical protein
MIDDIRKKHERQVKYWSLPGEKAISSVLTISDVDALFAALDSLQKKIEKQNELIDFYDAKLAAVIKWNKFLNEILIQGS